MRNVLIVDDEPLARIGIQSMLAKQDGITVAGTAANGQIALTMIQELHPDIVIMDIKMPVMDGLAVLKEVHDTYSFRPAFIMLTSFEEFEYVRTAIKYHACYYLMKMELNMATLTEAIHNACQLLDEQPASGGAPAKRAVENIFVNRFYFNLLNYCFHSDEEILAMAEKLELDIRSPYYVTIAIRINSNTSLSDSSQSYSTYLSIIDTLKEVLCTNNTYHFVAFRQDLIGLIIASEMPDYDTASFNPLLLQANGLVKRYFGCNLSFGIGKCVSRPLYLSDSFSAAVGALASSADSSSRIMYYKSSLSANALQKKEEDILQTQNFNRSLILALEGCDVTLFTEIMNQLTGMIDHAGTYNSINLISAAIHVIINCMNDGEALLTRAFFEHPMSYQSLYMCSSKEEFYEYLSILRNAMTDKLEHLNNDTKNKIVLSAKKYIQEHIYDKLTLGEVSFAIGVSQNYLSTLFSNYSSLGFTDYVASSKVQKAKEMLSQKNMKVYEVSEQLSFENAHYFSKVYKKFTGFSPTETPYTG